MSTNNVFEYTTVVWPTTGPVGTVGPVVNIGGSSMVGVVDINSTVVFIKWQTSVDNGVTWSDLQSAITLFLGANFLGVGGTADHHQALLALGPLIRPISTTGGPTAGESFTLITRPRVN